MRPRYSTSGIVLSRTPLVEGSALLFLLTEEFGLLKVRAQGVREMGAKLSGAVQTLSESEVILVRGKEVWRLSGALLSRSWARALSKENRKRAGRVGSLLLRLVQGESHDQALFHIYKAFLEALSRLDEKDSDTAELISALFILRTLGFDAGEVPEGEDLFSKESLARVEGNRKVYIARINNGIAISGL